MAVYLRKRNLTNNRFRYYLDIWHNGKRSTETLFTVEKNDDKKEKKTLAETIRSQRALQLEAEGSGFTPTFLKNVEVLLYFEKFITGYTKADQRLLQGAKNKFEGFLGHRNLSANITFKQLTEGHFRDFADYLNYDSGLSGETPHNYWKKFKMIVGQAKRDGLITASVYEDVIWKKKGEYSDSIIKKEVLTEEEIRLLWETECGNEEVKKAFLYACYTGLGLKEIQRLTWREMRGNKLVTNRSKTGVKIDNVVSQKMLDALGESKADEIEVFHLRNQSTNKYLTSAGVDSTLRTWVKRAGIKKHITFYCGRHTFGTRLLLNGADLKTVADAMGHTTTQITSKYLNHINTLKDYATASLE